MGVFLLTHTDDIKTQILTLYNKQGNINAAITRRDWFKQSSLCSSIYTATNFLLNSALISERIFCVMNDITEVLICPCCQANPRTFLSKTYSRTCNSKQCIASHPDKKEKRNHTMMQTYGALVSDTTRIKTKERLAEFHRKGKLTLHQRYGVVNSSQIQAVKDRKIEKCRLKYGVDHHSQSTEIKEKRKFTCLTRYNNEFPTQTLLVKGRISHTCQQRYGVSSHRQKHNQMAFTKLNDRNWLHHQYVELQKPASVIARELGLVVDQDNSSTVARYLHKHKIDIRRISAFSYKAIGWLNQIMKEESICIKHALNGGEYNIPGTRFMVDGYCESTNTVYEFHGDLFHGNPVRFQPSDKCHPFDPVITAGELFQKTVDREQQIKDRGYLLVSIWESDYETTFGVYCTHP